MALTKIGTDGVKDDAITSGKIPANAVGSSEIADNAVTSDKISNYNVTGFKLATNSVSTTKITDQSVTAAKIANNNVGSQHIANGEVGTTELADQAVTLAKLEHGTSSNDGKFLRANNGADPTFETVSTRTGRNIIVNGACLIAQRGTDATGSGANGYATVDRFSADQNGTDAYIEQHQVDVASGTTPYTLGFRKAFQIKNGNQSSGAGTSDKIEFRYNFEAQDIANSGWNYVSSSSFITLSFWVKSSVAQNFYFYMLANDGTQQNFPMETGSLSADTWTKITKTIAGASNVQFDNNNENGMTIVWDQFRGTDQTGSVSLNTWAAFSGSARTPDQTSTWYTTNDATFEITGVQLEVGSVATPFEHKSYPDYLRECERYYVKDSYGGIRSPIHNNDSRIPLQVLPQAMRTTPSASASQFTEFSSGTARSISAFYLGGNKGGGYAQLNASPGNGVYVYVTFDAEL